MKLNHSPDELFRILENADDETILHLSKNYTAAGQEEMERIFKKSQEKYRLRTLAYENSEEKITCTTEATKTLSIFKSVLSAAACLTLTFLAIYGIVGMKPAVQPEQNTSSETVQESSETEISSQSSEMPETIYVPNVHKETSPVYETQTEPSETETETESETESETKPETESQTESETVLPSPVTIMERFDVSETETVTVEETSPVPTTELVPITDAPETEIVTETELETEPEQETTEHQDFIVRKSADSRDASIIYEKITPVLDENAPETIEKEFYAGWLPDGFACVDTSFVYNQEEQDILDTVSKQYKNSDLNYSFTISQRVEKYFESNYALNGYFTTSRDEIKINGHSGYYYTLGLGVNGVSYLLYWKQDNYIMCIESYVSSLDEIVQIAESIGFE